jgi:hypothetical protein
MFDAISYSLTDAIRKGDLRAFIAAVKSDPKWPQRLARTDFALVLFV